MRISILKKFRSRLFLKVLLIFSISLLFIITFVIVAHSFFFHHRVFPALQRNAVNHAQFIIKELGTPPDIQKAETLARALHIRIRFESPELKWASHKDMLDFPDAKPPAYDNNKRIFAGFTHVGFCVEIRQDNGRYLLILHTRKEGFRYAAELFVITIIIFATFLTVFIYIVMQWLLKPVKVLREGVRQLSEGNIHHEMSTNSIDELGQLVDSFNTMTQRIREMIRARDRLLRDVSHELRSPLTRVKVAMEFLEDNNTKKNIRDDISEMETMITELLETDRLKSQHGKLELEETNILKLIQEVCTEFQVQKPGIKIASFPDDIFLKVDQKRIKILFRNILDNALRYSHPDGYPVEISLREKTDEFIISIQDFGSGIPEQDLPYVFEPFYRVDKSRSKKTGGYGLGMSLSKRIIEAHKGTIEITSRPKIGATIFLKFKR